MGKKDVTIISLEMGEEDDVSGVRVKPHRGWGDLTWFHLISSGGAVARTLRDRHCQVISTD